MPWKIALCLALLLLPLLITNSSAETEGAINEVVGNDEMQIYVLGINQTAARPGDPADLFSVYVILKNIEPKARAFISPFAKVLDSDGNQHRVAPLLSSIQPIRIAPNDTLTGVLSFPVPIGATINTLVWQESEGARLEVDLTKTKSPPDFAPKSDIVLSANKGKVISDGRSQITIHDELLEKNPAYYLIDISIKNIEPVFTLNAEPVKYNPSFMFVKDQHGNMYPADIQNFDIMNKPLKRGELGRGQEVRGEVLFLLPETVDSVMFIFDENIGLGSYLYTPEFPY
ncbi:MAG: DUF4352 domain-containing protein, partial [Nitrososphaerales archaeon]